MPATKWTEEAIRAEAAKYDSKVAFVKGNESAYRAAVRRHGSLIDDLFGSTFAWTEQLVREESAKYKTRIEFMKNAVGAYNVALKLGILDQLHTRSNTLWTEELIREEAKKYNSKQEMKVGSNGARKAAAKLGILDDLFEEDHSITANDTIYVWRAVGMFYNDTPIYKIGITSHYLGTDRIRDVAKKWGVAFEIICCEQVRCKASTLEKKLHLIGQDPKLPKIDGHTEFRALNDSALYTVISMICESL